MTSYDLCLAWNWKYDADSIVLLDTACRSHGLSLLQITPDDLVDLLQSLVNHQITFRAFLDRASDTDACFIPLVQWARHHAVYRINPHEQASRTWDKAAMHLTLSNAGLHTPYTIILPSYEEQPDLPPIDLGPLGDSFAIKPAHGGGGEGVVIEATSLGQVLVARQEYPTDRYLLQAHIVSTQLGSRSAWFRVIYCAGQVYPCWWDTRTHVYTPVTFAEESRYCLSPLHDITASIARLCRLDLFSTEISLTPDGLFVIVDYVNDQIDLRLQSKTLDGVPDDIVHDVAERLAGLVAVHCPPSPSRKGDMSS
ncbi:MAG: hypothetical protein GTN71_00655 [Anaerolineae bacterium]|nr:hypothetical protein [Anaerolineae bacterium]